MTAYQSENITELAKALLNVQQTGTACRHPSQAGLAPGADECPWLLHPRRGWLGDFDPGCGEVERH